ncbi:hypothetical protein [Streptomyces sp. NPDC001657]|uniref:hypothetical protein n=1 Tax=Streptomyces sp. NPDC001657 TaxID=3154522 RepID=UPI00332525D2
MTRRIVLVPGAPGAGKTTLALPLSEELRFPLLAQYDRPLGYGPVITVDTTRPTDPSGIAAQVRQAFDRAMTGP